GFGARGNFGIRGIRIFVDGIPAGLPDGQVQVDSLDASQISSIEVLRGPAAAQYGNGAGGVILIETVPAEAAPPWQLSLGLGENGFENYAAAVKAQGEGAPVSAHFTASRLVLDGHREQARSDHRRMAAKLSFRLSERDRLDLSARATDAPLSEDPGGLGLSDLYARPDAAAANNLRFNAGESLDQQSVAWRWRHEGAGDGSAVTVSNYFTWRDFENRLPFQAGGSVRIDRRLGGISAQYRWSGPLAANWVAGIETDQQRDRRQRFDNDFGVPGTQRLNQEEIVTAAGAYLGSDHALGPYALQTALRFDSLRVELRDAFPGDGDDSGRRRFQRLSHGLGLSRRFASGLSAYARFASSYDTPTTTELANPLGSGFNTELDPQTSLSYEAGIKAGGAVSVQLALYQVDTRDELVAFELAGQPGRSFFENAGASRRRGAEVSFVPRARGTLDWRLVASWADAEFRRFSSGGVDFSGNILPGTPALRLAGSLDWQPGENWRFGADLERVERVYADNANAVRSPDYLDVGVRIAWGRAFGSTRFETFAGVKNLLDRVFADNLRINAFGGRYFEPAPGRYLHAGVRLYALP
ncbi:MAG: TonB-dependent receptor plug domain-containing protein, partial [Gammaproteobacteria bacterium]|nr:TonB-dependent receptor plug domain-containing protein [Gammaproteobacteria bacterium]